LTGTGGVPGLDAALSSKQATLSGTADVPGLSDALAAKQNVLTHPGDVPQLGAILQTKQNLITSTSMLSPTLVADLVPAITYLGQIVNDTDARNLTE